MTTVKAFIKKHPVPAYYALAFVISWGGILVVIIGTGGIPGTKEQFEVAMPLAIPALLAGPSVASLLLTGLCQGKAGLRDLVSRLFRWRVGARWYAVALLAAPLLMTVVLLGLSLFSPKFFPGIFGSGDKASRLMIGIAAGLSAGIFEELGWTGFAIPRLRHRHGVFATGLIAGVLWGAWHIPANVIFAGGAYAGTLSLPLFMTARGLGDLVGQLPAFRVLMVGVYDRTGSLLVAMLMHVSLTASTIILEPVGISGGNLLIYDLAVTVAWWVVVAAVVRGRQWRLLRRPDRVLADRASFVVHRL